MIIVTSLGLASPTLTIHSHLSLKPQTRPPSNIDARWHFSSCGFLFSCLESQHRGNLRCVKSSCLARRFFLLLAACLHVGISHFILHYLHKFDDGSRSEKPMEFHLSVMLTRSHFEIIDISLDFHIGSVQTL